MSKTRTVAYDITAGLKAEIDKFFEGIKRQKEALAEVETRYTEELEALKAKYYPEIEQRKEALRRLDLELEAIIIEKKVNWDELEKWPDEKLIACGTERVVKEKIIYELK
jgi:DNA repair ATPase RecN